MKKKIYFNSKFKVHITQFNNQRLFNLDSNDEINNTMKKEIYFNLKFI